MKKYLKLSAIKGFTLIELLEVIAIIGILASVVLISLNSARQKAKDTKVISDVQQVRTALETGFSGIRYPDLTSATAGVDNGNANCNTTGSVNSATFANCVNATGPQHDNIAALNNDAVNAGGNLFFSTNPTANAYAIRGELVSDPTAFVCIDSTGHTNFTDNNTLTTAAQCN